MLPLGASAVMLGFGFVIAFDYGPARLPRGAVDRPGRAGARRDPVRRPHRGADAPRDRRAPARGRGGARRVAGARAARDRPPDRRSSALAVAAGFAFAISLGEFGATVFLARPDSPTLPVAIFRFLGRPGELNVAQAYALAVVLMAVTAASIFARRAARACSRAGWF